VKILFVAMANSVHLARWIGQLPLKDWRAEVFSSTPSGQSHPQLRDVTVHHFCYPRPRFGIRQRGLPVLHPLLASFVEDALEKKMPGLRAGRLAALIRRFRPDVIHSLEIQHSAYLTEDARKLLGGKFPRWIVTNWGSDIQAFYGDPVHATRIREILARCDAYTCECERDLRLAREIGFRGMTFPPSPNAGGYDLARIAPWRTVAPSSRRGILVKGYHGWAGRALVALRALEAVADLLRGYRICVYSTSPEVATAARKLAASTDVDLEVVTSSSPLSHDEMLQRHGRARVSLGLSMSDGVSTSFLEALVMGSFPIQSWTSCANEWIADGQTGLLVPPEDPEEVAVALRRALTDDALVDAAAEGNWAVAKARLDAGELARAARSIYEQVARAP
jgi:glycosyltransferase involved in cell wall biosynthesis